MDKKFGGVQSTLDQILGFLSKGDKQDAGGGTEDMVCEEDVDPSGGCSTSVSAVASGLGGSKSGASGVPPAREGEAQPMPPSTANPLSSGAPAGGAGKKQPAPGLTPQRPGHGRTTGR